MTADVKHMTVVSEHELVLLTKELIRKRVDYRVEHLTGTDKWRVTILERA